MEYDNIEEMPRSGYHLSNYILPFLVRHKSPVLDCRNFPLEAALAALLGSRGLCKVFYVCYCPADGFTFQSRLSSWSHLSARCVCRAVDECLPQDIFISDMRERHVPGFEALSRGYSGSQIYHVGRPVSVVAKAIVSSSSGHISVPLSLAKVPRIIGHCFDQNIDSCTHAGSQTRSPCQPTCLVSSFWPWPRPFHTHSSCHQTRPLTSLRTPSPARASPFPDRHYGASESAIHRQWPRHGYTGLSCKCALGRCGAGYSL